MLALLGAAAGCSVDARTEDGGVLDAASQDAHAPDARVDEPDASPSLDAATADATAPDAAGPDAALVASRWFEDVTHTWGVVFDRDGADDYETLPDRMGGAVCPLDVDGVAPLDLFFAMRPTARSRSRLYVASQPGGAGTAVSYAEEALARGLSEVGDPIACLAFDADRDGDDDLLVHGLGTVRLFTNDGGSFTDVSSRLGLALDPRDLYAGAAAGDVDGDGDVDLFVAGLLRFDDARFAPGQRCGTIPCRSALFEFAGIADLLLLQQPDGSYLESARTLAPDLARSEMTFVAGILRMTGRGPVDLWVGNDLGARYRDRVLRRGASGPFTDVGIELGLATNSRGYGVDTMGWSQGDLDGDGELDFVASSWPGDTTAAHYCAPIAPGEDLCEERGRTVGLALSVGSFRWGEGLGDLDLDGDLELFEAAGHLYAAEDLSADAGRELQRPNLFENVEGHLALRAAAPGDGLDVPGTMRGLSLVDLDDDGRLDVVMAPARGEPRLLRNVREPSGHWLRIVLEGQAAGARVEVTHDGGRIVRAHPIGEGFLGNFDPRVHVGLPASATRATVRVEWPSGAVSSVSDVSLDRELTLVESDP